MAPKWHILYGFLFSIGLVKFFDFDFYSGIIVFLAAVFIDLDHATRYVIKTGNWNPLTFLTWSKSTGLQWHNVTSAEASKQGMKYPFWIFHGLEALAILFILGKTYYFAHLLFIGFFFHMILDYIQIFGRRIPKDIKISQIWVLIRNSQIKN